MDAETLLRTVVVTLSLFGLPLLALANSWRGEETPTATEGAATGRTWGL